MIPQSSGNPYTSSTQGPEKQKPSEWRISSKHRSSLPTRGAQDSIRAKCAGPALLGEYVTPRWPTWKSDRCPLAWEFCSTLGPLHIYVHLKEKGELENVSLHLRLWTNIHTFLMRRLFVESPFHSRRSWDPEWDLLTYILISHREKVTELGFASRSALPQTCALLTKPLWLSAWSKTGEYSNYPVEKPGRQQFYHVTIVCQHHEPLGMIH